MADTVKQEVVQLLEQAKSEASVEARIGLLDSIIDICTNKEASLLSTIFPSLLALNDVQSKTVELWFAKKIEVLCKSHNERMCSPQVVHIQLYLSL